MSGHYRLRLTFRGPWWTATIAGDDVHDYVPPVERAGFTAEQAQRRAVARADKMHRRTREVRVPR